MNANNIYKSLITIKAITCCDSTDQEVMDAEIENIMHEVSNEADVVADWIVDAIQDIANESVSWHDSYDYVNRGEIEEIVFRLNMQSRLDWADTQYYDKMREEYHCEDGFLGNSHKKFVKEFIADSTIGWLVKEYLEKIEVNLDSEDDDLEDDDEFSDEE